MNRWHFVSYHRGTIHGSSITQFEATGLKPFTTYFYQFNVCGSGKASPIGRTKTTPSADAKVAEDIKLAVYSCSNYRNQPLPS